MLERICCISLQLLVIRRTGSHLRNASLQASPSPALNVNIAHSQSLVSTTVSTGLFISLVLSVLKKKKISNLYLAAATVPTTIDRRAPGVSSQRQKPGKYRQVFTSVPCEISTSVLPTLTRVIAHHPGLANQGIWKGLCMEGRLTRT